jgi:hypothetical protein
VGVRPDAARDARAIDVYGNAGFLVLCRYPVADNLLAGVPVKMYF